MKHILYFNQLLEKLQMVTADWSIVSNESSFDKKPENGYLVFSKEGTFSIIYKNKSSGEESRMEFFASKENSSNKKSICECKIITNSGSDRVKKLFDDITNDNIWDIVSVFFNYCDLEKIEKNEVDKFLMGFSKAIKEVQKSEEKDLLPPSFNMFYKYLTDTTKNTLEPNKIDSDNYDFTDIVNKFLSYFKNNKKY